MLFFQVGFTLSWLRKDSRLTKTLNNKKEMSLGGRVCVKIGPHKSLIVDHVQHQVIACCGFISHVEPVIHQCPQHIGRSLVMLCSLQQTCCVLLPVIFPCSPMFQNLVGSLAAFLEAKKAKETEKATQRAVTNCGRAGFRINASTCKYILDSFRERSCIDKPWVEGQQASFLGI